MQGLHSRKDFTPTQYRISLTGLSCVRAEVIAVGNEKQKEVPEHEGPTLLTELLLQEVCVNLSARARTAPGGFWLSFWQLHLVALITPKKRKTNKS